MNQCPLFPAGAGGSGAGGPGCGAAAAAGSGCRGWAGAGEGRGSSVRPRGVSPGGWRWLSAEGGKLRGSLQAGKTGLCGC